MENLDKTNPTNPPLNLDGAKNILKNKHPNTELNLDGALTILKKKEASTSAVPETKSDLGKATGSSDGSKYRLPEQAAVPKDKLDAPDLYGAPQENSNANYKTKTTYVNPATGKASKGPVKDFLDINRQRKTELSSSFSQETKLTNDDIVEAENRLKTEEANGGFWGGVKQGLIETTNKAVEFLGLPRSVSSTLKIEERKPFSEEIKQVKIEAKKNKQQLSEAEVQQKAKELFVEKQKDNIFIDKANSFLDNLDQTDKKILELDRYDQIDFLSEDNKKRLRSQAALKMQLESDAVSFEGLKKQIEDYRSKNIAVPEELINEANDLKNSITSTVSAIDNNYAKLSENDKDLSTAEKEFDLFKRENRDWVNIGKNIGITTGDIGVGFLNFLEYVGTLGGNLGDEKSNKEVLQSISSLQSRLDKERELLRKPVESIESVEGFVNYATDLVATQLPILAATATGTGGLAVIGASSTGEKYAEMNEEVIKGEAKYSPLQMAMAPLLYGGAEVVSELPTLAILKKGQRVLKSAATSSSTELLDKTIKEKAIDWAKDYGIDMSKEMAGEQFTNFTQNFTDKYVLGKKEVGLLDNTGKVFKDTFTLTSILKVSPHVAGAIVRPFQSKNTLKELDNNSQRIIELTNQLELDNISDIERNVLKKELDKVTTASSMIMANTIDGIDTMPDELYDEVLRLTKEAGRLKSEANEIDLNSNLSNKKALLSSLETEFNEIQSQRQAILEGRKSVVEVLPLKEQETLKRQAMEDLVTELNPDGSKDIEITDQQVLVRANEIYQGSKENEKNVSLTNKGNIQETPLNTNETSTENTTTQTSTPSSEEVATPSVQPNTNEIVNEGISTTTTPTDGNVSVGDNFVDQNRNTEQQNTAPENIQSANDVGNIEEKNEPKAIKVGKFNYSYVGGNWKAIDSEGNEKPKNKTAYVPDAVFDKRAENLDFTQGQTAVETGDVSIENYERDIARISQNPSEIAETLAYLEGQDATEGLDYKSKVIAEIIGSKSVERESFNRFGDRNAISGSIALQYFSKKGKGKGIDQIAMEASEMLTGDYNANDEAVTPQDVVDFILENPSGTQSFLGRAKKEKIDALKTAFTDVTGLPAKDKYLKKAISQADEKIARLDNDEILYQLSEEELLNLDNEYENYRKYEATEQANQTIASTERSGDSENTQERGEQPTIQENGGGETSGTKSEGKQSEVKSISENSTADEINISDLQEDENINEAGFFGGSNRNQRDLLLSENGPVKFRYPFQKYFKRIWATTFKSNSGLSVASGEVVRSRNRILSAYSDHINSEAVAFNKIIRSIKKQYPKSFNKNLLVLNDYLSGDKNADISFLNTEQKNQIDYFRERIDGLSKSLIDLLELKLKNSANEAVIENTKKLIQTLKDNMGIYITRNYQIFKDDAYRDMITGKFEDINKEGQLRIINAINYLIKEEGLTKEEATKNIAEYLADIRKKKSDFIVQSSGSAVSDFFKKKKEIPQAFRELLGESREPISNYVNTVYKISQYLGSIEYQNKLREHLLDNQIGTTEAKLGYVKIAGESEGWQILNDVYVPTEFKDAFDDMQPLKSIESDFYKAWIKVAGLVKINKTILSPTTTARNLLSGVFLGANSGHFFLLKPTSIASAWNQAWSTNKSQKELFNERQKLIKLGILGDGSNSGEIMAVLNDFSKEVDRMVSKNKLENIYDFAKTLYAFGDDFYKVSGFYVEKDRLIQSGLSENEAEKIAAFRINNGYPTYSYLPKNIQKLRRIPLLGTFVSFPYEAIRSTKNNLLFIKEDLNAGRQKMAYQRLAGMFVANATLNGLSMLSMSLLGLTDDDDDAIRDMLPEWQKNSQLIYLGTKNGKPLFIDGTAFFPSEVIFKPLSILTEDREGRNFDEKLKTSLNELLSPYISKDISFKTAMEISENENQYNQKIYQSKNLFEGIINEPDKIINHMMKQAGPGIYNNATEFLRANEVAPNYMGDKFSAYGKEYTNEEALLGLFGFRISTINYASAMSSFASKVKRDEKENKTLSNKLAKKSSKLDDETINKIVKDYNEYHKENYASLINIINSAKKLGMTNNEIEASLKSSKISKIAINDLIEGKIPDLTVMSKQTKNDFIATLKINYKGQDLKTILLNFENNYRKLNRAIIRQNNNKKPTN